MAIETDLAIRQLRVLTEYAERLTSIIEDSKKLAPAITVHELTKQLTTTTGPDERVLWDIFNAIDQISSMARNLGGADKALDRLFEIFGKERLSDLDAKWKAVSAALELYDEDNPVAISIKARKLSFLHEHLLSDAEIITDARPVCDSTGTKVWEWVITHSLVLTYQTHRESSKIHFTLDAADVVRLRKACDRAVIKARTLKEKLGDEARVVADDA